MLASTSQIDVKRVLCYKLSLVGLRGTIIQQDTN